MVTTMLGYETRDGVSIEEQFHGKPSTFEYEIKLAKKFVLKSTKSFDKYLSCPVCGSHNSEIFMQKWGVNYLLCPETWTIYAPCLKDEVKLFEKNSSLSEFRKSLSYQKFANEHRKKMWEGYLNWVIHRVYRYKQKDHGMNILLRGIRYKGLINLMLKIPLFEKVDSKGSIIWPDQYEKDGYDAIFYLDTIQRRTEPLKYLQQACMKLKKGGLLFLNTRTSSGFDILSLGGEAETIFPYEHIFLPTVSGISILLEKAGFKLLETSTPGMFDVAHVYRWRNSLAKNNHFARFLVNEFNEHLFSDLLF